jgi:pimeloyl-ACP methyl ester carboxylesterase
MPTDADRQLREWPHELGLESQEVVARDGTTLRVVVGGVRTGPRVVLLHGAPQHAFAWRKVLAELVRDCFVVAPDLRGYGASELSRSGAYDVFTLAADVIEVLRETLVSSAAEDRTVLVAHDWGGPIAYQVAAEHPELLFHLVVINGPHLGAYAREVRRPAQALKAWYAGLAQLPGVERWLERRGARGMVWMIQNAAPSTVFTEEELEVYRAAAARPGRCGAILDYYRDARRTLAARGRELVHAPPIQVRVTLLWGESDRYLASTQAEAARRYLVDSRVVRLPYASHWVPEERPDAVVQVVRDALGSE